MADHVDLVADLDFDRARLRGYPEAVYCEGKSDDQLRHIAERIAGRPEQSHLFTRASAGHAEIVLQILPDAFHDPVARLLAWPPTAPPARRT